MTRSGPILVAKIADDNDFLRLKNMVDQPDEWNLDYDKNEVKVWTKSVEDTSFNMVKVWSIFSKVQSVDLYNSLQDPEYRKEWDQHMIVGVDIGHLNPNNDVSYYAMSCPPPLKNRDFVLQRSWLDTGNEHYIINHSICHKDYPPQKGFVRAISLFTGYLIRQIPSKKVGCELAYVTSCDPQGILPSWLVNKCTQIFAPKYIKQLEKAAIGYCNWKSTHNPNLKPWIYPEQIGSPKINIQDCIPSMEEKEMFPQYQFVIEKPIQDEITPTTKANPKRGSSLKSRKSLSKDRQEESQPSTTNRSGNSEESPQISNAESNARRKILSWLDFTKTCRRRNPDS